MPRATDDVHVRQTQPLRRIAHRVDTALLEIQRRKIRRGRQFVAQAMLLAGSFDHLANFGNHRIQASRFQVPEVQGHAHFAGNDIARAWIGLQAADRTAGVRLMTQGGTIDRSHDNGGADQGVLAQVHWRRAGMGFDSAQLQVEPLLPESPHDHADRLALILKNRALLDVRFKIGTDRVATDLASAGIADGIECFAHGDAVGIDFGQGFLQRKFFREDPRAHHARRKTRALFVGPDHNLQRGLGFHAQIVERAQHLNAGQHTKAAIELATGGLGVDVAAGHYRRQVRIAPGTAGENIADRVDADGAARLFAPPDKDIPSLAIKVSQGQATDTAFDRGAKLGQFHERLPQAIAVDVLMGGLQNVYSSVHVDLLRRLVIG